MAKQYPGYDTRRLQRVAAQRDGGWKCHYCGCELVPSGTYYYFQIESDTTYLLEHGYVDEKDLDAYRRGVKEATIDHKIARANGGDKKDHDNAVLACRSCNSKKHVKRYEDFKK